MDNLNDIESQRTDNGTRHALWTVCKSHLAQLQQPAPQLSNPPIKKIAKLGGFAGSSLEPQRTPAGSVPGPAGSCRVHAGFMPGPAGSDPPATAKNSRVDT